MRRPASPQSNEAPCLVNQVSQFSVRAIELLEPSHPVYALRPKTPLEIVLATSFYAPRDSFVYPGGV
jgi:hypothetical protein